MTSQRTEALKWLNTALTDPAMLPGIRAECPALDALLAGIERQLPKTKTAPVFLPAIDDMNAIQATIFDNWPRGRRVDRQPHRYGMCLEVWTQPGEEITARIGSEQHKVNLVLMDAKALKGWVKSISRKNDTRKIPLSADFLEGLAQVASGMAAEGEFVGICGGSIIDHGTVFFDHQWVHVVYDEDPSKVRVRLMIDGRYEDLPPFDTGNCWGTDLTGKAILQSRHDRCGFSVRFNTTWTTDHLSDTDLAVAA